MKSKTINITWRHLLKQYGFKRMSRIWAQRTKRWYTNLYSSLKYRNLRFSLQMRIMRYLLQDILRNRHIDDLIIPVVIHDNKVFIGTTQRSFTN